MINKVFHIPLKTVTIYTKPEKQQQKVGSSGTQKEIRLKIEVQQEQEDDQSHSFVHSTVKKWKPPHRSIAQGQSRDTWVYMQQIWLPQFGKGYLVPKF